MDIAVLIVAHGSKTKESYKELQDVVKFLNDTISEKHRLGIYLTYNEKKECIPIPDWREVLENLLKSGVKYVILVLLFIAHGVHIERDIVKEFTKEPIFNQWIKTTWKGYTFNIYITKPLSSSTLFRLAVASNIAKAIDILSNIDVSYSANLNEIENESLKRVNSILEIVGWATDDFQKNIMARVVFASGNIDLAYHVFIHPAFLDTAREILVIRDIPVVTDVKMVYSGIRWRNKHVFIDRDEVVELAKKVKLTRAAASMIYASSKFKTFIPVVGNSPSALLQILKMIREGELEIPLIVATPPGFVNAVLAKQKLIEFGIPCITVRGSYGGSSLAVAIFNGVIEYVYQR